MKGSRGRGGSGGTGQSNLMNYFKSSKEANNPGPSTSTKVKKIVEDYNPAFDEEHFKEGETVRKNVRSHLNELVKNGSIRQLESGTDTDASFRTSSHPQFVTKIQYGMIKSTEITSGLEVYHCSFPDCLAAPLQCKTRCNEHLDTNISDFIIGRQNINTDDDSFELPATSGSDISSYVEVVMDREDDESDIEMNTATTNESKKRKRSASSPTETNMNMSVETPGASNQEQGGGSRMDLSWFQPDSDDLFPEISTQAI